MELEKLASLIDKLQRIFVMEPPAPERRLGLSIGSRTRARMRREPWDVLRIGKPVALGITNGKTWNDYHLAVRIQDPSLWENIDFRRTLHQVAEEESEQLFIGSVEACSSVWQKKMKRPLQIGSSVGQAIQGATTGTIGAFPIHKATKQPVILSNHHVLALHMAPTKGAEIIQPGRLDKGKSPDHVVGKLLDWATINYNYSARNQIDAAIASIDVNPEDSSRIVFAQKKIIDIGTLSGIRQNLASPMPVFKTGRTTGKTAGVLTGVQVGPILVTYANGTAYFDKQLEIVVSDGSPFSDKGDSGSLILDLHGHAIGLLFANADNRPLGKHVTYANDLHRVFWDLGLEF